MRLAQGLIFFILAAALGTGCATKGAWVESVDGLVDEVNARQAVAIKLSRRSGQNYVRSYGRVGGYRNSIALEELVEVTRINQPQIEVVAYAALQDLNLAERILTENDGVFHAENAIQAFSKYYGSLPSFKNTPVVIRVVLAQINSGLAVFHESVLENNLDFITLETFTPDTEMPSGFWWSEIIGTVIHELLHLHYELEPSSHNIVNEETAASLLETCVRSDLARLVNSTSGLSSTILSEGNQLLFPGISNGVFKPSKQELKSLPSISIQGDSIATAIIFLETGKTSFTYNDINSLDDLKNECLNFGSRIPDFLNGKRPWLELEQ